jgi:hypothetical protein
MFSGVSPEELSQVIQTSLEDFVRQMPELLAYNSIVANAGSHPFGGSDSEQQPAPEHALSFPDDLGQIHPAGYTQHATGSAGYSNNRGGEELTGISRHSTQANMNPTTDSACFVNPTTHDPAGILSNGEEKVPDNFAFCSGDQVLAWHLHTFMGVGDASHEVLEEDGHNH